MTQFKVGDKVCCMDTGGWTDLEVGKTYTVAKVEKNDADDVVLQLEELLKKFPAHNRYARRFKKVVPVEVAGRKDDAGKLDMTLLDDMPRAVKAVVEVMQWANTEKKPVPYERGSWLGVSADRYRAAIKRHDRDACEQSSATPAGDERWARFERDKETNKLHLAHIATSALMALELVCREEEKLCGTP